MFYGRKTKTAELAEKFRDELLAKRLPKGSPVLSERELAEHFAISPVTARRILKVLVEQDILYRKPQSGTFIKHDPPVIPVIAYAGPLPDPENMDPLRYDATSRLMKHFAELGIEPILISPYELRHPAAWQKLRKTSGLLIHDTLIDKAILKALVNYSGRISLFGKTYFDKTLPFIQVFPDFTGPLLEFDRVRKFEVYDKILIIRANHNNSKNCAEIVRHVLKTLDVPEKKIEVIRLNTHGGLNAYLQTDRYFSQRIDLPDNTLIISLSEYFSQAIRAVFSSRGKMPDILSFDNMESYQKNPESAPFFTSIDWQVGLMACRALDLLCSQDDHPEKEKTHFQIPAKLVIRESVKMAESGSKPKMISNSKNSTPKNEVHHETIKIHPTTHEK
ncbi:MAG: GntR family transcriptional regulator [bacterium]